MPAWTDAPSLARLRALEVAGGLAYWAGDIPAAYIHYEAAEREARGLGDEAEIANALYNRFFAPSPTGTASSSGRTRSRTTGCRSPARRWRSTSAWATQGGIARCLWAVGMGFLYGEDLVSALAGPESRASTRSSRWSDAFGLAWARFTRGVTSDSLGDPRAAIADYALAFARVRGGGRPLGADPRAGRVLGHAAGLGRKADAYLGGRSREPLGGRDRHPPRDDRTQPRVPAPRSSTTDPELRAAFDEGAAMPREAGQRLLGAMLRELAAEGSARA